MSEVDWNPVYSLGAWNNIAGPCGHRAVAQPLVEAADRPHYPAVGKALNRDFPNGISLTAIAIGPHHFTLNLPGPCFRRFLGNISVNMSRLCGFAGGGRGGVGLALFPDVAADTAGRSRAFSSL